jgi:Brp/Blh family beta-carotene 15,15'-monooxygenase
MPADRLVRFVERVGWASCLGTMALAATLPVIAKSSGVQWSPWLAGLLVLGIPHGAFDHRVGAEFRGRGGGAGVGFYAAYLAAGGLVLAVWFFSPRLASLGFLAVAAAHFGQGDLYWSRESGLASQADSLGYRAALFLSRSLLPVALPILAFPQEFSGEVAALASRLFGRSGWSIPHTVVTGGLVVVFSASCLQMAWASWLGFRMGGRGRQAAAIDVGETLLLMAMFWLAPPVLALGVYFNAWHSLRHVARLLRVAGPTRELVARGRLASAFGLFFREALPMTAGAMVLMVAVGVAVGRGLADVADLGLLALVFLSALTLPHVLVVAWMDRRQGIWSGGSIGRPEELSHVRV